MLLSIWSLWHLNHLTMVIQVLKSAARSKLKATQVRAGMSALKEMTDRIRSENKGEQSDPTQDSLMKGLWDNRGWVTKFSRAARPNQVPDEADAECQATKRQRLESSPAAPPMIVSEAPPPVQNQPKAMSNGDDGDVDGDDGDNDGDGDGGNDGDGGDGNGGDGDDPTIADADAEAEVASYVPKLPKLSRHKKKLAELNDSLGELRDEVVGLKSRLAYSSQSNLWLRNTRCIRFGSSTSVGTAQMHTVSSLLDDLADVAAESPLDQPLCCFKYSFVVRSRLNPFNSEMNALRAIQSHPSVWTPRVYGTAQMLQAVPSTLRDAAVPVAAIGLVQPPVLMMVTQCMATEYLRGMTIYDWLLCDEPPRLGIVELFKILTQMVRGLIHLHDVCGVIHRDYHAANVMIMSPAIYRRLYASLRHDGPALTSNQVAANAERVLHTDSFSLDFDLTKPQFAAAPSDVAGYRVAVIDFNTAIMLNSPQSARSIVGVPEYQRWSLAPTGSIEAGWQVGPIDIDPAAHLKQQDAYSLVVTMLDVLRGVPIHFKNGDAAPVKKEYEQYCTIQLRQSASSSAVTSLFDFLTHCGATGELDSLWTHPSFAVSNTAMMAQLDEHPTLKAMFVQLTASRWQKGAVDRPAVQPPSLQALESCLLSCIKQRIADAKMADYKLKIVHIVANGDSFFNAFMHQLQQHSVTAAGSAELPLAAAASSSSSSPSTAHQPLATNSLRLKLSALLTSQLAVRLQPIQPKRPHTNLYSDPELQDDVKELKAYYKQRQLTAKSRFEVRAIPAMCGLNRPTQLGIVCTEAILEGTKILFYSDCWVAKKSGPGVDTSYFKHLPNTGSAEVLDGAPIAQMYQRYCPIDDAQLKEVNGMRASAFLPRRYDHSSESMNRFNEAPKGMMINNTADRQLANVKWVARKSKVRGADIEMLVASKDIAVGDEFLYQYHNPEARNAVAWAEPAGADAMEVDDDDEKKGSVAPNSRAPPAPVAAPAASSSSAPAAPAAATSSTSRSIPSVAPRGMLIPSNQLFDVIEQYLRIWDQRAFLASADYTVKLNSLFLLRNIPLPPQAPQQWLDAISQRKRELTNSLAGESLDCSDLLRSAFDIGSKSKLSPLRNSPQPGFINGLVTLRSKLGQKACTLGTLTSHTVDTGSMLIDDWIVACNSNSESSFFQQLARFDDFFASNELSAELDQSTVAEARRQFIIQVMYLATHVVFVQTDYMTKRPTRSIVALQSICAFLLKGIDVIHPDCVAAGDYYEIVGECISVFGLSPDHTHHCESLWDKHIFSPYRSLSSMDATTQRNADHFIAILLQIYCVAYPKGEGKLRAIEALQRPMQWDDSLRDDACIALAEEFSLRIRCVDASQADKRHDHTFGSGDSRPLITLYHHHPSAYHSTQPH